MPARARALVYPALPLAAATALWVFLVNRVVIHWVDGPIKTLTQGALALALGGGALFVASRRAAEGRWKWSAVAVLALFAAGEVRRLVLRERYGAALDGGTLADALHPVTTTDLVVRRFSVDVPGLRAARVRVVHVSDVHVTASLPWSYFERIQDEIRALHPDVVVMTGDYVSHADRLGLFRRWLAALPAPPGRTFATLGNHDYWTGAPDEVRKLLREAGVHVIGGACETAVVAPGATLRFCGTEEPWGPGFGAVPPGEGPTLALTHTPDNVYALHEQGVLAIFAGHTHGGQFRVPALGAVVIPSRYGRRFDRGHFVVEGTHLFVSAGVGADAPALRLWCPPELVSVDLRGSAT